jgi:Subtilase family
MRRHLKTTVPSTNPRRLRNNGDAYIIDRQYGCFGQTSNAAAATTGAIALLLEDYDNDISAWPLSSTIKALLIHTALDLDDSTDWYNKGPDFASGYGLLRIQNTIAHLWENGFVENKVWHRVSNVLGPQELHYHFTVPVSAGAVKVTLAWDDQPATENASHTLVSDLDLILRDPDGGIHYPWTLDPHHPEVPAVRTQPDHINNTEQVLVDTAIVPGDWEAIVIGTNINDEDGYQVFSLVGPVFTAGLNCDHAIELEENVHYSGETSTLYESNVIHYPPFLLGMDGPEAVHQITTTCRGDLSVEMTDTTGNLWVFLLSDCDPQSTKDWAAGNFTYPFAQYLNAPPGTYIIVVDSPDGQSGEYTIAVALNNCQLAGDSDGDGDNDGKDLSELAPHFGLPCNSEVCPMDMNGDGDVDSDDLKIFAGSFGKVENP